MSANNSCKSIKSNFIPAYKSDKKRQREQSGGDGTMDISLLRRNKRLKVCDVVTCTVIFVYKPKIYFLLVNMGGHN